MENPSKSEVIGRCGGDKKNTNDHAEPTKSRTLKNTPKNQTIIVVKPSNKDLE